MTRVKELEPELGWSLDILGNQDIFCLNNPNLLLVYDDHWKHSLDGGVLRTSAKEEYI